MNPTQNPSEPCAPDGVTPAFILRAAALYLQRHGWTQGAYYDLTAPVTIATPPACARGAIAIACYGYPIENPWDDRPELDDFIATIEVFDDYIDVTYLTGMGHADIDAITIWWNDRPHRTADEVIAALRAAADDYEQAHPPVGVS